jgi:signal recognition particle subunit SRP54
MFSFLSKKFNQICDSIKGISTLDSKSLESFFNMVKDVLIEADVHYFVIEKIIKDLETQCVNFKLKKDIKIEEFIAKKLQEVLIHYLGGKSIEKKDFILKLIEENRKKKKQTIVLLAGLQGAGKTTLISKLVYRITNKNKFSDFIKKEKVCTTSFDYDRPAARLQLKILSERLDVKCYFYEDENNSISASNRFIKDFKNDNKEVAFIDIAGRISLDNEMMNELKEIYSKVNPDATFVVVDCMMGQEGLNITKVFCESIKIDGAVITKVDSNAPSGVIFGITSILNIPIKYISTGEKPEEFDYFDPSRAVDRLLGHGDLLSLAEIANEKFGKAEEDVMKDSIKRGDLNIDEYLSILKMFEKFGPLKNIISMIPGSMMNKASINDDQISDMEDMNKKFKYMRDSMTKKERKYPDLVYESKDRVLRIMKGSGLDEKTIYKILCHYKMVIVNMNDLYKRFGSFF